MQVIHLTKKVSFFSTLSIFALFIASFIPIPAYAAAHASFSVQAIQKQSDVLYRQMRQQRRSQAEIDTTMLKQFGLQRMLLPQQPSTPLSGSDLVNLPTPTIYRERTYVFIYADFNWTDNPYDPTNYTDDFGMWFTQTLPVSTTSFSVTNLDGSESYYSNPTNFTQAGADFSATVGGNYWGSGSLEISINAVNFPSSCFEIFTKYTHGWFSNTITGVSLTAGFPASAGLTVNYGTVANSWQATSPQPAAPGC